MTITNPSVARAGAMALVLATIGVGPAKGQALSDDMRVALTAMTVHTLYHELAHAYVDLYDIPHFGPGGRCRRQFRQHADDQAE